MLHDPVIDEARAQGVSIAEYLQSQHKARRKAADKWAAIERKKNADRKAYEDAIARREKIAKLIADWREERARQKAKWRTSWREMVAIAARQQAEKLEEIYASFPQKRARAMLEQIIFECCAKYGLTAPEIKSTRRDAKLVIARMEYYFRARQETSHSFIKIGTAIGKDHTTVISGIKRYEQLQRIKAGLEPADKYGGYRDFLHLVIDQEPNA